MSSGMGNETKKLEAEIDALKKRIEYLEQILDQAGIPYDVEQNSELARGFNLIDAICDILSQHINVQQDKSPNRKKKRGQQQN